MNYPRIESYSFGSMTIGGKTYTEDLIITPDGIIENWRRKDGHSLDPEDILQVMDKHRPRIFIMGKGANSVLTVPKATREWIEEKGARLIDLPSGQAVEEYNKMKENHEILAGFHLTC